MLAAFLPVDKLAKPVEAAAFANHHARPHNCVP
jgi:hypothetical protein